MAGPLGIMVATQDSLDHLLGLVTAAEAQGVEVRIFLTGEGVLLTQDPRFGELAGRARMALCEVSFRAHGLEGDVPGLGFKDFATQAKHAEMLEDCPHYLML
jgi:predicted peroxiredoxin